MNLRFLKTFLAVHSQGSISQAAERVHLSPAAVSAQLKALESELGLHLFERTGCALKATGCADRLAPLARDMLVVHARMRGLGGPEAASSVLRLGAIGSSLPEVIPRLLAGTRRRAPGTDIKVVEGTSAALVQMVRAGTLDCAVVTQPPQPLPGELLVQPLYSDPFVAIGPPEAAGQSPLTLLRDLPYIAFDRATWAGQMIDAYLERACLRVAPTLELDSLQGIAALVRGGAGVSIVPWVRGASWDAVQDMAVQPLAGFQRPVALVQRREHARPGLRDTWAECLAAPTARLH
jgi:DNA-binding transcriptional LysR family regulator